MARVLFRLRNPLPAYNHDTGRNLPVTYTGCSTPILPRARRFAMLAEALAPCHGLHPAMTCHGARSYSIDTQGCTWGISIFTHHKWRSSAGPDRTGSLPCLQKEHSYDNYVRRQRCRRQVAAQRRDPGPLQAHRRMHPSATVTYAQRSQPAGTVHGMTSIRSRRVPPAKRPPSHVKTTPPDGVHFYT